jgi:hypothetical protein
VKQNKVSTIIPVFNRPDFLEECVGSVVLQDWPDWELILVDDGSDDPRMPPALQRVRDRFPDHVRMLRRSNGGPGAARQTGLEHAQGEFVQFLDSDDLLLPKKFKLQVEALKENPDADIAYGKARYTAKTGNPDKPWKRTGECLHYLFPELLTDRVWNTNVPLYRASFLQKLSGWTSLRNEEDWEFDAQAAAAGARLVWVNEWLSDTRNVATERTSHAGSSDPQKLCDRARARLLILDHALRAGIPTGQKDFQNFIRYSFLVARQCAAAGQVMQAERLVERLHEVSPRKVMQYYLTAGRAFGFGITTRVAEWAYRALRTG